MREPGGDMTGLDTGGAADAKPAVAASTVSEARGQAPDAGEPVPSWTVPRIRGGERVPVQWGAPGAAAAAETTRSEIIDIANQPLQPETAQPSAIAENPVAASSADTEATAEEPANADTAIAAELPVAAAEVPGVIETPVAATEVPAAQDAQASTETSPIAAEATPLIEFTPDMSKPAKVDALVQRMLATSSQEYTMWKLYQSGTSSREICAQFSVEPNTLRNLNRRVTRALSGVRFEMISSADTAPVIIQAGKDSTQDANGDTFITQKALAERVGVDVKALRDKMRGGMENGQIGTLKGLAGTARRTLVNESQAMQFLASNRSIPGLEQQPIADSQPGQDAVVAEQPVAGQAGSPAEAPTTSNSQASVDALKPAA